MSFKKEKRRNKVKSVSVSYLWLALGYCPSFCKHQTKKKVVITRNERKKDAGLYNRGREREQRGDKRLFGTDPNQYHQQSTCSHQMEKEEEMLKATCQKNFCEFFIFSILLSFKRLQFIVKGHLGHFNHDSRLEINIFLSVRDSETFFFSFSFTVSSPLSELFFFHFDTDHHFLLSLLQLHNKKPQFVRCYEE